MQRIEPRQAAPDEGAETAGVADRVAIAVRDHEAAQHEEEIDEQIGMPQERADQQVAERVEMIDGDQRGADAAQAVERLEAPGRRCGGRDRHRPARSRLFLGGLSSCRAAGARRGSSA